MRVRKCPVEIDAWPVRSLVTAGLDGHRELMSLIYLPRLVQDGVERGLIEWDQKTDRLTVWEPGWDECERIGLNDWLIRDEWGDFEPVSANDFEKTYELV